jgi:hypothetical protein
MGRQNLASWIGYRSFYIDAYYLSIGWRGALGSYAHGLLIGALDAAQKTDLDSKCLVMPLQVWRRNFGTLRRVLVQSLYIEHA